jgi:hypothetical protein
MSTHAGPPPKKPFAGLFFKIFGALAVFFALVLLLLPEPGSGPAGPRTVCKNNIKQIALALHNYHDEYGCFPPAYIADRNGRPMHSWRVLLLPFLEFKPVYQQYRFDEPWDGPRNREIAALNLQIFRCPSDSNPEGDTNYLVVVGPKTVFPGAKCVRISEITSGTTNTILLVEVAGSGIKWAEPRDLSIVEAARGINPKLGLGISSHHEGGAQIALVDGSVRFFKDGAPPADLRAFCERDAVKPGFERSTTPPY